MSVRLYVVAFAGGINDYANYIRYRNDLTRFARACGSLPGSDPSRYWFLHAAGGTVFDVSGMGRTALAATRPELAGVLGTVAQLAPPDDHFVFLASNHGGQDATKARST